MSVTIRQEDAAGHPLLKVEGRLDANAVPILETHLNELLNGGHQKILLDFSRVEYVSSSGMRLLLSMTKKLKEKDGQLILFSIREEVMEVIRLAGFEKKILSIFSNKQAALEAP